MLESAQTPNYLLGPFSALSPSAPPPSPPLMPPPPPSLTRIYSDKLLSLLSEKSTFRVTSEFDSDSRVFFQRISCKLFDNLARLKLSFINNNKREILEPQLMITSKYLSIHYDPEEQNALLRTSFDVGSTLHFSVAHDVKAQQGEVSMYADLPNPGYGIQLSSPVPSVGLPQATIRFPKGEVTVEEKEHEDASRTLSMRGILRGQVLNGLCSAHYMNGQLNLRYIYKDRLMSFIPSISIPSNAVSFAFKRRLTPRDKLSYWYKLDSNNWSAVYKHKYEKYFKFRAGYDSQGRLGWASIWVGDENGKARTAPMKMKVQFMLQVPQDDITCSTLMFRCKKRWDIL
ncbi:chloroplast outer envelope protein 37, ARABIDOPSIS CHLOROPLAST OUTER ENVELOPE PROTEIN 37 [Hibiscus trionum]|uniref:Chloroplast outer envelope protein 37, ARABIDOPSIS CHLOROPLAST OUTER ENVELOPE PROTEIN 37 n=1 Tax=Hibiscus trionum TaxID=183268 RepID=A0A9W7J3T5_HIBTR|nr:chloroplast outer envelope protein 37, ARABIDOPSIS CHLOROPLAST OUTER ENVELOPE PROTEIN 37 [Hibiscus trionum]